LQQIDEIRQHGWEDQFEDTKSFCIQYNIIVPNMLDTTTARGRSRGHGGQLITYHHHLKHEIFNVVLDQLIVELNNRFGERSTRLLRCIACLDPKNSFANFDGDKLIELAKLYDADFSTYDCIVLKDQLEIFIIDMRADPDILSCNDLGDLAMRMVRSDRHVVFTFVYRLIELALILPVATTYVERAFSSMNIIKTKLRNKTGDEWLNHRMVCYIERDIFTNIEDAKILDYFQGMKTRRVNLPRTSGMYQLLILLNLFNITFQIAF
jgi:hypothetical protein